MGNIKNYSEAGGEKWVVNGTLEVTSEGKLYMNGVQLTRAIVQTESTAADVAALKADFNALLTKLKNAGLMSTT
ncbi:MAG: head fiber protein [Clostridiaceae bacterium]